MLQVVSSPGSSQDPEDAANISSKASPARAVAAGCTQPDAGHVKGPQERCLHHCQAWLGQKFDTFLALAVVKEVGSALDITLEVLDHCQSHKVSTMPPGRAALLSEITLDLSYGAPVPVSCYTLHIAHSSMGSASRLCSPSAHVVWASELLWAGRPHLHILARLRLIMRMISLAP